MTLHALTIQPLQSLMAWLYASFCALTRERIRELLTSPLSDRIAFVSFAPAIYAASMSYIFLEHKRFSILSCLVLGLLFIFNIIRFTLTFDKLANKKILLICNAVATSLFFYLIYKSSLASSRGVLVVSIVAVIGITILQFASPRKFSLSGNIPALLTILFLNLLSIIYVTDIIGYAAVMLLIIMLSVQLCYAYDFFPHEEKPLRNIMAGILLLFFSVFVLTPLRFVLMNPEDYIIPIKEFFPYLPIYTLLLTVSFFAIFYFLVKTKIRVAYIGLFCTVSYLVYSSIPYDIGQIKDFMLENPNKLNVSLPLRLVEIVIVSFVFFLGYGFMVKKKGIIRYSRSIVVITIILPSVFLIDVGQLFFNNYEKIADTENQKEKTILLPARGDFENSSDRTKGRDKLTLSSNGKNIVILFLDAFSSQILPDLFEKKPELRQELDGFVWYKDTITAGSWTWIGTPGIWGGHDYTPDKFTDSNDGLIQPDQFVGAYKIMPTEMLKRGFKVNYYNQFVYTNLIGTVLDENFKSFKIGSGSKDLHLLHGKTYLDFLPRVTLFIGLPFFMKSAVYNDGGWRSELLTRTDSAFYEKRMDWEALSTLKEYSSEPLGDVFTFFMSLSTHGPYFLNWGGEFSMRAHRPYWDYDGGIIASYYALQSVVDLIKKLKSDGLYERTKIILVSDHGNLGVPKTQTRDLRNIIQGLPKDYGKWFDALLMVKEFDASGPLKTDDSRFMSNADVLSFAMGEGDQIPAGRTLMYTAQYGDDKGRVTIQMDTSLTTDGWKVLRNGVTADCNPTLPGCAQ